MEVRWHARGGQGAKTAAQFLATAALKEGKYIQAFSEYGPERMGAPIVAFTRISSEPISIHSHVTNPDIVVVLDPTLIGKVDLTDGLSEDGIIIVNTKLSAQELRDKLGIKGRKIFTVDATGIALDTIGRNIPNTPMLGALVRVTGLVKLENTLEDIKSKFSGKFKDEVVEANIEAIKRAHEEVKSE